ncbi:PA14 domain-containing protein [Enterococcus ureasiticus]|uniref:PA14 domain-containing protein n=1 Tax=Enterococcus ureasiticus TaxID=903984 RepID=A0A1E5GF69_9ENTE|nr:PA14 domain-containing protein [Enterococcus ureasiticus]OEG11329.1 hypothetical protein BCR21_08495 [Enterococcus ureasiticus]
MILNMKKRISLIGCILIACFTVTIVNSSIALAEEENPLSRADAKLVHGVYTEYFKREGINYIPVASQYENKNLDYSCNTNREPYPGIKPSNGFRVSETAYMKVSGTGTYMFSTSSSGNVQVYINDVLVQPTYPYVSLQDGQIVKIKVISSFPTSASSNAGQYRTDLYWKSPANGLNSPVQRIPQELLYTTPDLLGVDVVVPDKLVHGVFTEYEKRQGQTISFIPVASQFEDSTLDFSCQYNEQPYPGIDPASGFQVKKTAYIKLTDTGNYRFASSGSIIPQVYINDVLVQETYPMYLQAGQIIKVKVVAPFYGPSQVSPTRYSYDLRWSTPSSPVPYKLIPQELLYTTPDLNGV